jgi:hypothetical protein
MPFYPCPESKLDTFVHKNCMCNDQISYSCPNAVIAAPDRHTWQKVENSAENNVPCAQVCSAVTAAAVFLPFLLMTGESNFVFWVPDPQTLFLYHFFMTLRNRE